MADRSERWKALRFAGLFAAAATIVWAVLLVVGSRTTTHLDAVAMFQFVYVSLNLGGEVLGWLIGGLHDPSDYPPGSVLDWGWLLAAQFIASFVQGLAYAFLWSVWRRSRDRAALYLLASAVLAFASFGTGTGRYSAMCDAMPDPGDCDMGIIEGLMWAAVAFGVAVVVCVLVEARIRSARTA